MRDLNRMVRRVVFSLALTWVPAGFCAEETWLLIDTTARTLSVMQGEAAVRVFENMSIGRSGATTQKIRGDQKTPLGTFRVSRIKLDSIYHRFIGIDYPDLAYTGKALESGLIGEADYAAIRSAHEKGIEPPASTPLGGFIGIHGIGEGDPAIHEAFNWTEGCVALTNEEVEELLQWVELHMVVLIL